MYVIIELGISFNTWQESLTFLIEHPEIGGESIKYVKKN